MRVSLHSSRKNRGVWDGMKQYSEDQYYSQAVMSWRYSQTDQVIRSLAAEYRKRVVELREDPNDLDPAVIDGYAEAGRRWGEWVRAQIARQLSEQEAVSERPSYDEPIDEASKGNGAITVDPDPLPDRNDDSIIAANLIGDIVKGLA